MPTGGHTEQSDIDIIPDRQIMESTATSSDGLQRKTAQAVGASNPYRSTVLMLISMLIILGVAEGTSRLFYLWHWGGHLYDIQPLSYSMRLGWVFGPGSYREFDINSVGFRRPDPVTIAPRENTIRVFLVGGSTAFGMNGLYPQIQPDPLSYQDTIDYVLQNSFEADDTGLRLEVINAAVPEYRLFQEITLLEEKLLNFRPDAVIFLDGHNDISFLTGGADLVMQPAPYWSNRHVIRGERVLNDPVRGPLFFLDVYLGRNSYFYHGLSSLFQRHGSTITWAERGENLWGRESFSPNRESELREKYADRLEGLNTALPLYLQLVKDLKAIATARNIPVMYVLQPEVVAESSSMLSPQDAVVQQLAYEHHRDYGTLAWRYLTRKIYEALMPLSSDNFRVVDLTKVGTPHSTTTSLYTDYCHLTREGNVLVASHLKPVLTEILARHRLQVGRGNPIAAFATN